MDCLSDSLSMMSILVVVCCCGMFFMGLGGDVVFVLLCMGCFRFGIVLLFVGCVVWVELFGFLVVVLLFMVSLCIGILGVG